MSQRCEDFQGFLSNTLLLITAHMLQGPHIMQTVPQFNNYHAYILSHSQNHLTIVFQLLIFFSMILKLI